MFWLQRQCPKVRFISQRRIVVTSDKKTSFLALVREVDAFPSRIHELESYKILTQQYYKFKIAGYQATFGLFPKHLINQIQWPKYWTSTHTKRTLSLDQGDSIEERSKLFAETLGRMVGSKGVPSSVKLRGETVPVYGPNGEPVMHIDRAGSILFGTVMYGIQLLAYTNTDKGIRYWVPRRSKSVSAYAGMLDHCAGGALNSSETPMDTVVREADEEASLPLEYVRANAKSFGVVSYHMARNANNGPGHQPQVMYTYSIELPQDMVPTPSDGEVEKFQLMDLEQVKAALFNREFKANCVLTWISYLISQGIINADNEPDLHNIRTHLHRRLDFPAR